MGVGSPLEFEGEKLCALASQYSSRGRQGLITGEVKYIFGHRTSLDKTFSVGLIDKTDHSAGEHFF